MNLKIGENIRLQRREMNITQEDLASRLGVTFQSVSRWENGTTYPDIELIPQLAGIFNVSVDYLIGMDKQQLDEKRDKYIRTLAEYSSDEQSSKYVDTAKEALKEFPGDYEIMILLCEKEYRMKRWFGAVGVMDDIRRYCTRLWNECDDFDIRNRAISVMTRATDDEEEATEWIRRSQYGKTSYQLLLDRYESRWEMDKFEPIKEQLLLDSVKNFCFNVRHRFYNAGENPPKGSAMANNIAIKLLDLVSEGGNKDAFLYDYAFYYTRYAAGLFSSGSVEEGYTAMEKAVDMILRWFDIPDGTEIPYDCYCFRDLKYVKTSATFGFFSQTHGWEWFDCVRDEERYKELAAKVEAKNKALTK